MSDLARHDSNALTSNFCNSLIQSLTLFSHLATYKYVLRQSDVKMMFFKPKGRNSTIGTRVANRKSEEQNDNNYGFLVLYLFY